MISGSPAAYTHLPRSCSRVSIALPLTWSHAHGVVHQGAEVRPFPIWEVGFSCVCSIFLSLPSICWRGAEATGRHTQLTQHQDSQKTQGFSSHIPMDIGSSALTKTTGKLLSTLISGGNSPDFFSPCVPEDNPGLQIDLLQIKPVCLHQYTQKHASR